MIVGEAPSAESTRARDVDFWRASLFSRKNASDPPVETPSFKWSNKPERSRETTGRNHPHYNLPRSPRGFFLESMSITRKRRDGTSSRNLAASQRLPYPDTWLMNDSLPMASSASFTSRRSFLRRTSHGAAAAVAAPALFSRLRSASNSRPTPPRVSTDTSDDPLFMSATKLAGLIRSRTLSAVEVVKLYLGRIEQVNPRIHAIVTLCPERALAEAAAADVALASGRSVGALHGVPMTIADVLDTAELVSSAGTPGRQKFVPAKDATVVSRLRSAGAILLGKSNPSEFALGGGAGTTNPVFGPTYNPYDSTQGPGGPAGGAGAVVAVGGAAFDLGSGVDGALRRAAAANGIAGLQSTCGFCPRTGHILNRGALYDSLLQLGPLARRVEDLALLLPILVGPDGYDAMVAPVPLGDSSAVALKDLRVAFYTQPGAGSVGVVSPEVAELVKRCAGHLAELGCRVVEEAPPKMAELREKTRIARGAAGGADIRRLFQQHGSTADPSHPDTQGQEIPCPDYTLALLEMDALKSEQLAWVERFDLVLGPASVRSPRADRTSSKAEYSGDSDCVDPYEVNGWPAGVVRAGTSREMPGMPLGVQIAGQPWRDHQVLAALAFLERRTGGWQRPSL